MSQTFLEDHSSSHLEFWTLIVKSHKLDGLLDLLSRSTNLIIIILLLSIINGLRVNFATFSNSSSTELDGLRRDLSY